MRRSQRIVVILATLLVLLVVGPLVIPFPPAGGTLPAEELADPDSRFVQVGDLRVHYKLAGQGKPVLVLLHGMGASVFSWREVMAPLAQSRTVIAFDRPGFGLTSRPMPGDWQGESPYSAESQVNLTVGLLDAQGIQKAVLVGHSAGGSIAVLTALRFPERVSALVLVSPAVYGSGGGPSWLRPLLAIPHVRRWGPLFVRWLASRGESLLASAWHDPKRIQPDALAGYAKGWKVDNWDRALWEFALAGRPLGLEAQLDRLRVPTLVITGDDDRWVPTEQSVRLAREVPDAELVVLQACGHLAQEEQPAEFLAATEKFLGELPR